MARKKKISLNPNVDPIKAARRQAHDEYVAAMAEGRRQRAYTFTPKKGKGSYRRDWRDRRPEEVPRCQV